MEANVVWNKKWTSNILESHDQNIQKLFGKFYDDICG
jgi:hypothetical protein